MSEINELIATYEMLAAAQDAMADDVASAALRTGWTDGDVRVVDGLRHQAETNRHLAQEVRAGAAD
jgi:hypothetical protein